MTTAFWRRAVAYIRWAWQHKKRPFAHLWEWGNRRQKLAKFQALQKWAGQRQRRARTRKSALKWKRKKAEYAKKVDRIKARAAAKKRRASTGCNTSPGSPHWGGATSILENEVEPVAARHGVGVTSAKRSLSHPSTIANPGSDHSVASTRADARDLGTYNGRALAYAIASALGISGYRTGTYTNYYIRRCGHTFRVQILWAVSGHYDHVHVGIRLVS